MRHATLTAVALAATLLLAACTGHKKDATQAAARVDGIARADRSSPRRGR